MNAVLLILACLYPAWLFFGANRLGKLVEVRTGRAAYGTAVAVMLAVIPLGALLFMAFPA